MRCKYERKVPVPSWWENGLLITSSLESTNGIGLSMARANALLKNHEPLKQASISCPKLSIWKIPESDCGYKMYTFLFPRSVCLYHHSKHKDLINYGCFHIETTLLPTQTAWPPHGFLMCFLGIPARLRSSSKSLPRGPACIICMLVVMVAKWLPPKFLFWNSHDSS